MDQERQTATRYEQSQPVVPLVPRRADESSKKPGDGDESTNQDDSQAEAADNLLDEVFSMASVMDGGLV